VSYLFSRKGIITYPTDTYTEDQVLEQALEAGAEDVSTEGEQIEVICAPEDFEDVQTAMQEAGFEESSASISKIPQASISLDPEGTRKALKLIELLDDHDDVQEVSTNLDIPDDLDLSEE
jgi:transcriptional/translational regulatory protein YebC/TACO1